MQNARFLDIYAGAGSVGIEALSRGADFVVFIEKDTRSAALIRQNLADFNIQNKAAVFRLDALGDLSMIPGPFSIIFMGPPYKDPEKTPLRMVEPTLANLERHGLLANGGIVVAQHHKKETFKLPGDEWVLAREEKYGDTLVSFIKKKQND